MVQIYGIKPVQTNTGVAVKSEAVVPRIHFRWVYAKCSLLLLRWYLFVKLDSKIAM